MKQPTKNTVKVDSAETYNLIYYMFHSAYMEMRELTRKTPKETLSPMKIKMLNRILEKIRDFFSKEPAAELPSVRKIIVSGTGLPFLSLSPR